MKMFDFLNDVMELLTILAWWIAIVFIAVKFWQITLIVLVVGFLVFSFAITTFG